jgi:hypothetical protein
MSWRSTTARPAAGAHHRAKADIPLLDPEFREQLATLLGQAHHGDCDIHQVLATARRIIDGDADSWGLEWVWTAGSTWAAAGSLRATAIPNDGAPAGCLR